MPDSTISAIAAGLAIVISAGVAGWVALRKTHAETEKAARNGVIEEWRAIALNLTERAECCDKEIKELRKEKDNEIRELRLQITQLMSELSALRAQLATRETESIRQQSEIRELERSCPRPEGAEGNDGNA